MEDTNKNQQQVINNQNNKQLKNKEKNMKMKEIFCQLSFLFSTFILLLSMFGTRYGFMYALTVYFALVGLETKRKKTAIAALIITLISFIISFTPLIG